MLEAIGKVVQTKKSMKQIIPNWQRPQQAKKLGGCRVYEKNLTYKILTYVEVTSSIKEKEKSQKEREAKKKQRTKKQKTKEDETTGIKDGQSSKN